MNTDRSQHQHYIGKRILFENSDSSDAAATPPADGSNVVVFVNSRDLPACSRIVRPRGIVTMDCCPWRLNLHVDSNNNVLRISYG